MCIVDVDNKPWAQSFKENKTLGNTSDPGVDGWQHYIFLALSLAQRSGSGYATESHLLQSRMKDIPPFLLAELDAMTSDHRYINKHVIFMSEDNLLERGISIVFFKRKKYELLLDESYIQSDLTPKSEMFM